MNLLPLNHPSIQMIPFLSNKNVETSVLRLDKIHPVVSGNKWYKLKEYLKEAKDLDKKTILTFGGAYSNHLVATAASCNAHHFHSIGIVRGEASSTLSHSLKQAMTLGMKLLFISREEYKSKKMPTEVFQDYNEDEIYLINEGGYGLKGAEGAKAILEEQDLAAYTHIIAAVGTGTTLAGLVLSSNANQTVIGIPVLKNNFSLQHEVEILLPEEKRKQFLLIHDYHFGGYAKRSKELIDFMNRFYDETKIATDFVYTGKLFFAVKDLLQKKYFEDGSHLLIIHSGGLQGNNSLPKGTLVF